MATAARTHRETVVHREDREHAPGPESPVPKQGRVATTKRTVKKMKSDRITMVAAGVAFYWFLAIFPLLIAVVGILALVGAGPSFVQNINTGVRDVLPGSASTVLTDAIGRAGGQAAAAGGLTAAIVGVALALWSASSGMGAAQDGLDVAYDVPEDRKFLKKRLMSLVLLFGALVLGSIATALLVFGKPIGDALADALPLGGAFELVWTIVRWVMTVLAVMTLFALFYYLGPNRKPRTWKWVSPGGVVGVIIWLAASVGFSFYVSSFGQSSYGKTYGSLAGVVVLVLWLYLSALALLIGGELNGELERGRALRDRRVAPTPDTAEGTGTTRSPVSPPAAITAAFAAGPRQVRRSA
jgi:membrane protein